MTARMKTLNEWLAARQNVSVRRRALTWAAGAAAACLFLALYALWYLPPNERGMLAAHVHHAFGHHEIKVFGKAPLWRDTCARLLDERYGVELSVVGGAFLSRNERWYVDGYNSVTQQHLTEKHGVDVFEECRRAARKQWETWRRTDGSAPPPGWTPDEEE